MTDIAALIVGKNVGITAERECSCPQGKDDNHKQYMIIQYVDKEFEGGCN